MSNVIKVVAGSKKEGHNVVKRAENLSLNALKNVNIVNPQHLDVLIFNSDTNKWISRPDSDIRDLSNVNIDCGIYGNTNTTIIDGGGY